MFNDASSGDSSYNWKNHEAYMLDLQVPSGFVMEPGEVVLFSVVGERLPYYRTGTNPSGVKLVLNPGVTSSLPTQSGVFLQDMWGEEFPPDAEIRVKLNVPSSKDTKIVVQAVNRTSVSNAPFFEDFVANARNVESEWSDWMRLNDPALSAEKRPLVIYDASLKTQNSADPINMFSHFNVRASAFSQGSTWDIESQAYEEPGSNGKEDLWWGEWVQVNSWNGTWLANSGRNGYWGGSNTASGGERFVTLFELPTQPLLSVASLQHAQTTYMPDEPTMVIGNSFASLFVDPDYPMDQQPLNDQNIMVAENKRGSPNNRSEWTMTRVDWSYMLNQALWDSYFFSGISPDSASGQSAAQRFAAFQGGSPLPQATLRYEAPLMETAMAAMYSLFDASGEIRAEAPLNSAARMRVQGMFNVNSTSVEAWRALLASTRQVAMDVQGSSNTVTPMGSVYTRTLLPENEENEIWKGFRNLSDAQISRLAEEIVRQVHIRGPFLNLSDFVNRRLRPSGHASQQAGPLQAAIDAAGLNDHISESLADAGMDASGLNPFVRSRIDPDTPVAMGSTGFLTQADLLTVIGPMLSSRSDTFVIRSYGEVGEGTARAWFEAVVQRSPDYVDSSVPHGNVPSWAPEEIPANTGSYDTVIPKRRFRIVSFRWLTEDDV